MTIQTVLRKLKAGAQIEKGSFSGYWLRFQNGEREPLSGLVAASVMVYCERVDDKTTRIGATYRLRSKK